MIQEQQRLLDQLKLDEPYRSAYIAAPRHQFVCHDHDHRRVYANEAMVIFEDKARNILSTISQPSFVFQMLAMLKLEKDLKVFELGAGSGWNAALMGYLVGPAGVVHTVEIIPELIEPARQAIARAGLGNVHVHEGDGGDGFDIGTSYDRAVFTAGSYDLPSALFQQVRQGGLLLFVMKMRGGGDTLHLLERAGAGFVSREAVACGFVPLTGKYGYRQFDAEDPRAIPGLAALLTHETHREPFWFGGKGKASFLWRTMAVRSFLAVTEPSFRVFKIDQETMPGFDDGTFGLYDAEARSLALVRSDEVVTYGSRAMRDRLNKTLEAWLSLGLPSATCMQLTIVPPGAQVASNPKTWVVERPNARFVYSL